MADYFPAFLDLRARSCLVVGGGLIGERKVLDLLAAGARVTLVSPRITPGLEELVAAGRVVHRARPFLASDLRRARLVIAATGVPDVDATVASAARHRGALVNVVDRPKLCDFIFGSVLRRGHLQIAVSTEGRCPALARDIRRRLEGLFGPEYADLVEAAAEQRLRDRALAVTPAERLAAGERAASRVLGAFPALPGP